ncbi:hydroxyacylglutathione hydrolase [Leptothrix ochracea]|uniref:hydroxyacylglutathione hydrolase n=1 Tax=Leptothrix ochracea TaxID=735331 RepID=UPI0034E287CB
MKLLALPAFDDNYIWLLHDGQDAVVVDPGEAEPVLAVLRQHALRLAAILVTHHHTDHIGGLDALQTALGTIPIYGPSREGLVGMATTPADGQRFDWLGLDWQVLEVPGHTLDHLAYIVHMPDESPVLFCGDTLFSAGCGRLFEGSPGQMFASLQRLSALPLDTRICCAHEYTLANLRFAQLIEPDNVHLVTYVALCQRRRAARESTLPARLDTELKINPFLRCHQPAVVAAAQAHGANSPDPSSVFAALRQWKNHFR